MVFIIHIKFWLLLKLVGLPSIRASIKLLQNHKKTHTHKPTSGRTIRRRRLCHLGRCVYWALLVQFLKEAFGIEAALAVEKNHICRIKYEVEEGRGVALKYPFIQRQK